MTETISRLRAANCCTELLGTQFLQALGEPVRASLLRILVLKGRSDIGTLAKDFSIDRSVVSRHLATLERAGIVKSQKEGRHTFYEIDGPNFIGELENLVVELKQIRPFCCP